MAIVKTENINMVYGGKGVGVHALFDVNIEVERGSFLALVGPSGSGKTTLLNIIGGLDSPTSGKVFVGETEITALTPGETARFRLGNIGFVFQEFNLIPVLNAVENVELVMLLTGVDKALRKKTALDLLSGLGLGGMEERMPHELSGGQKQRVAVARAIASKPLLVLADEPTANLDSKTGASLIDLMKDLNEKRGTTFIFSTHDRMVVDKATSVVNLKDGRVVP